MHTEKYSPKSYVVNFHPKLVTSVVGTQQQHQQQQTFVCMFRGNYSIAKGKGLQKLYRNVPPH